MAFDASHILKVTALVGEPIVFGDDVGLFIIADQFEFVDVVVTAQTDVVVVGNNFIQYGIASGAYLVGMGLVTCPAGKNPGMLGGMGTQGKFSLYLLKLEFGIFFVSPMAINADHFGFHSHFGRMWPCFKILGMAVRAFEILVIGLVKEDRIDLHSRFHFMFDQFFGYGIVVVEVVVGVAI